jgi:hypothetical protein
VVRRWRRYGGSRRRTSDGVGAVPPGGVSTGPSGGEVEMALAQGHQAASAWGHVTLARSPGLTTALPRLKGEWAACRRARVTRSSGGSGAPCPAAPK